MSAGPASSRCGGARNGGTHRLTSADPVAAVPVAGAAGDVDLEAAADWYEHISGGRWRPRFRRLDPVALPVPALRYAHRGGMGQWPVNSQQLAWEALAAVSDREALSEDTILLVPSGFIPHVWRLRRGGFPLGRQRWARRYAILPDGTSLGAVVHELGHLYFGWPDLVRELGDDCLMGSARLDTEPPPPCAPLRLSVGWAAPVPVDRATRVRDLGAGSPGEVGVWHWRWRERTVLVERRGEGLLVFDHAPGADEAGHVPVPRLLARVPLAPGDADRPLLALVAPAVRRAAAHGSP